MRFILRRVVPLSFPLVALALLTSQTGTRSVRPHPDRAPIQGLTLPFVVNQGQTDPGVRFYSKTPHGTVLVTDSPALVYKHADRLSLTESPVTAAPASIRGVEQAATRINIFRGNDPSRWHRDLSTYDTVTFGEVFDDIELTLRASATGVEKIFTVAPRANPRDIRMRLDRVKSLAVSPAGELVAATEAGDVTFSRPIAFQERDGAREPVEVAYTIDGAEYGFQVGEYDPARTLVIDPAIVSTFLGGDGDGDSIFAMRHDGAGHVYVTGWTNSDELPGVTAFSPDPETGGCHNTDAFVAKIDDTLGTVISATFLGGSFGTTLEAGEAIAMNPAGEIYVAGYTVSGDFPGLTAAASPDASLGGETDGFIVRLDNNLSTILAATLVGGSDRERIHALVYDNATGTIYAGGFTHSGDFPLVACSNDCTKAKGEGFVIQLDAAMTAFLRSTFLGGSNGDDVESESVLALAVDQAGHLFAAGRTNSTFFPFITGPDTTFAGDGEAFVVKFAPNLMVTEGTFFGSNAKEEIVALAVVENGLSYEVVAAGTVDGGSGAEGLLGGITLAVADPHQNGMDGFITKFDASLNVLTTTYVGGNAHEGIDAMAIPAGGASILVAGTTAATIFPGIDGMSADSTVSNLEMFVIRVSSDLTTIQGGSYAGGFLNDFGHAVAVDPSAGAASPVWVAGSTASGMFPGVTSSSADSVFGGKDGHEGVIARLPSSLNRPLIEVLSQLKNLLQLVLGSSNASREMTQLVFTAEALARQHDWQAATDQVRQFTDQLARVGGELRLNEIERTRLAAAATRVLQEIDVARAEDAEGTRLGTFVPRIDPAPAPSCPVLVPTRLR